MEWSVSLSTRSAQLTDQKLVLRVHWQQIFNATGGEGVLWHLRSLYVYTK